MITKLQKTLDIILLVVPVPRRDTLLPESLRNALYGLARISHRPWGRHRSVRTRSARRRPKSVAVTTVEAFDDAGGPHATTLRAGSIARQAASNRLPDVPASRGAVLLTCRAIYPVATPMTVRYPG